jgi:hypothetical protein
VRRIPACKGARLLCVDFMKGTGLMSGGAIYFLVFGPVAAAMGVALLLDVKGLGRRWENEVNRNSAHVGRLFGWLPNRYIGPAWRPVAGGFLSCRAS